MAHVVLSGMFGLQSLNNLIGVDPHFFFPHLLSFTMSTSSLLVWELTGSAALRALLDFMCEKIIQPIVLTVLNTVLGFGVCGQQCKYLGLASSAKWNKAWLWKTVLLKMLYLC